MRRDGYRGMLAIHPAQVDVINEAFTPRAEEIARRRRSSICSPPIPASARSATRAAMLDRPYLARARALLELAKGR